jgi:two-component system, LytTR family, sensor kinase
MKLRWREHEMIFVTIIIAGQIITLLLNMYHLPDVQPGINFAAGFSDNNLPFVYWRNALLPQLSSILLIFSGYLSVNLLIIPALKKISFNDFETILAVNILKPVLAIVVSSYLLAIGVNAISFYAKPHLFNYGGYQFLALFGYNDKPLTNIFFGFDRAIGLVMLILFIAGIRELIIWLLAKPGPGREYRTLIANNTTALVFLYLLILCVINPVHEKFNIYTVYATPVLLLYIYLTFRLFPLKADLSFMRRQVLTHLLLANFIAALPVLFYSILEDAGVFPFLIDWAFLFFIITPLTWLLYLQRKDKIVQLRGMEKALAKSSADLQFLRSQINPHFLFNALNTLYGTALTENAEHTAEGVQKLGDMMRFMLHENTRDFIPMHKESEYLKNYISLQQLRIQSSPDIIIEENIDEAKCNHFIAPMLFIPFVENAFKHGISLEEQSRIQIKLYCHEKEIHFEVRNSMHARRSNDPEQEKSGIGLKNVAERLKLIYPGKHHLLINNDGKEFFVQLTVLFE